MTIAAGLVCSDGDDCGGDTNIIVVPNKGAVASLPADRIRLLEQSADAIHVAVGRVLLARVRGVNYFCR